MASHANVYRRDSFITHRAFCDALAEETARLNAAASSAAATSSYLLKPPAIVAHQPLGPLPHHVGGGLSLWGGVDALPLPPMDMVGHHHIGGGATATGGILQLPGAPAVLPQLYADLFSPAPPQLDAAHLGWLCGNGNGSKLASSNASELTSVAASSAAASGKLQDTDSVVPSVFSGQQHAKPAAPPADMSATALLQKAAQMGAVTSGSGNANAMVGALDVEPADDGHHQSSDGAGGGLLFSASTQHNLRGSGTNTLMMSQLTAAAGNMPYDVLSAVRHAGLKDAAAVAVGREETRDFLGVGVQALCSSSLNGWI